MEKKGSKIDYSKYSFRPEEDLAVKAGALSEMFRTINDLIGKEGVGFTVSTKGRYDYVHKDTSEVAKPNTKKDVLDRDYKKVFSMPKTIEAEPEIHVTEVGKTLFSILSLIDNVRIDNLNAGKGTLITTLQEEAQEKQKRFQEVIRKQQEEMQAKADDIGLKPVNKTDTEDAPQEAEGPKKPRPSKTTGKSKK